MNLFVFDKFQTSEILLSVLDFTLVFRDAARSIQFHFYVLRVYTFILISGGCPWWADGNDAVESRYFISSLIGTIRASGWEVRFFNILHFRVTSINGIDYSSVSINDNYS